MSSIKNNRVDFVLDDTQVTELEKAFARIQEILDPFAQALSTRERRVLPKMNVSNKAFVFDAILAVKNNPSLMPPYLVAAPMEKDYKLYEQLEDFLDKAASITEKISDTQMLAGHEAYKSGLAAYRLFESAANAGLPGADSVYNKLASRFEQSGKATPEDPDTDADEIQPAA